MPRRTSDAKALSTPIRVVLITLDAHLEQAISRAAAVLGKDLPGLRFTMHAASDWAGNPEALASCHQDIEQADIILATMLFMEDHIAAVLPALEARRDDCDALVCAMSAGEVIRLTRMGGFSMDGSQRGPLSLLRKLRGSGKSDKSSSSGEKQLKMLRRLPRILRFIPGTAQDVRAYFLVLQYWLAGTDANLVSLVRFLVNRYADGPRQALKGKVPAAAPDECHQVGLYHPRAKQPVFDDVARLPRAPKGARGRVGVLLMRSYVLAGDTAHYDGVIEALEATGLTVIPTFASGLDARPAVERYFLKDGKSTVDAVISLTGFSLVGGPAYNDAEAAAQLLRELDVPYISAHPMEFQTLGQWETSTQGLHPVEATMMVAIPELDGAIGPMVIGGRTENGAPGDDRSLQPESDRVGMLAARVRKLVDLRHTDRTERRLAMVVFNFPPNGGSVGTAAHLSVFESLHLALARLADEGYDVGELPRDASALREALLTGNQAVFGAEANVVATVGVDDYVRREPHLAEIEAQWGPAPGRHLTNGESLLVLGLQLGNVLVAVQPGFGYEGDPMRLMFEQGLAPTHAFSAFYRYLREDFGAHAVVHFGTHGALEFMPGKQVGLSGQCWPDRLVQDLPNYYVYASNNPSEGTIAKRRSAATLLSYLTPPVTQAGLHRELSELKASLDHLRTLNPEAEENHGDLLDLIRAQAAELDLDADSHTMASLGDGDVEPLLGALREYEKTLIPHGLHVIGKPPTDDQRVETLSAMAEAGSEGAPPGRAAIQALVDGAKVDDIIRDGLAERSAKEALERLGEANLLLAEDHELPALVNALDGNFVAPAPGGDLITSPGVLPTGRNIHGFDPYRIPSAYAVQDGARLAEALLERHMTDGNQVPELVALVLWGTDNLKNHGAPLAQALALFGAKPRFDGYGRLAGAELIPLAELGRPRIDVMMTLSGIFRDLLPLQTRMLADAAWLAASADESPEENFVRKHALAYQAVHGCDLEIAALRVFSNDDGAYGSNVNHLIDQGCWSEEGELADTFAKRKCYAYGRNGAPVRQAELLGSMLEDVQLAYQNLESLELGVTTVDHYFDTLGGISSAVQRAKGEAAPVYIADQTRGGQAASVRTLGEQVALESRTRVLNPRWYESMLDHGYEGVRQIEAHVTNTMGWSATTGQVQPWVYRQLTRTFILDREVRDRLAALNPVASARVANRLLEAHERDYWSPDPEMLDALREAGEELEDQIEGVGVTP